jgi:tetratricopeptide (TPR) repeat protein
MRWWFSLGLAMLLGTNFANGFRLSDAPRPVLALSVQASDPQAAGQQGGGVTLSSQAKTAFDRGDFAAARDILLRAVKASPRDWSLWFHLGVAYGQLNDLDQATAAFEHARSLAPRQADTDFNLGLLYWKSGDLAKAKQAYKAGLALNPKEPSALQNYSLLLMKTGEDKDAIAPLTKLKSNPSLSVPARVSLIECYLKLQQPAEADREADELLQPGIAGPADQTKLAGIFLENGATQTAVRLLIHSLKLDPDQDRASATLGVIYMRQGKFAESAPLLERAVQLDPSSAEYAMAFAETLFLWNRPPAFLAFLKSVESRFSALPEFQFALAVASYENSHYNDAAGILEALLRSNPRRQDQIYFWLGNSDLELNQLDDAEKAYRKAIEINPKNPNYYEAFATLLRRQGPEKLDEAITQLKRAYQYDPNDPRVGLQLALCYESKDDLADAASLLEKTVQGDSSLLAAHIALARIDFRLGKKDDAAHEKDIVKTLQDQQQQDKMKSTTVLPNPLDEQP